MNGPLTRYEYCIGTKCQRLLWYCTHGYDDCFSERELSKVQDRALLKEFVQRFKDVTFIDDDNLYMAMAKTADAINHKKTDIVCGAFVKGPVSCRPDFIKKNSDGTYDLYIVKAITYIRQTVCHDASYQIFVLSAAGIAISDIHFVHINPNYVHGHSRPESKIIFEKITKRVNSILSSVEKRVIKAVKTSRMGQCPIIDIRPNCFTPFDCECKGECFKELPKYNVFDISGVDKNTKIELYYDGCVELEQVKDNPLIPMTQQRHIQMFLDDEGPVVDKANLKEFMDKLHYPLCFLDFECVQLPSPVFEGMRPYEQLAFQFSLHIVEQRDAVPVYKGFISRPDVDPRREIALRLVKSIPDGACVVAYGAQLEKKIVSELASLYKDLSDKLNSIHDSIVDIAVPVEKKYYFEPHTLGANSLKAVLHAMYPNDKELDYSNLEGVHNGKEAAVSYATIFCGENPKDVDIVLDELEKYCSLDTLALIKILDKFYEAVDE